MSLSQTPRPTSFSGSIGDELDRLEITVGKIGMNTPEQAMSLLEGLDRVYAGLAELDPASSSRRQANTQFESILARLHAEAGRFIRDLGGGQALREARAQVGPPHEFQWWYLDDYLSALRRVQARRSLITAILVVVALVVLGVLYQAFLAPSPEVAARYEHEQSALTLMASGSFPEALEETQLGLEAVPGDPTLLVMQGTLQEALEQTEEAQQSFAAAEQAYGNREDFMLSRAQSYISIGQMEEALVFVDEVVSENPQSAYGFLLRGQSHELLGRYLEALEDYDKAYEAANQIDQPELAALARTRTAMIMQSMGTRLETPMQDLLPTTAP